MTPTALEALIARYDAFLIDQFGVLLDGSAAYPLAGAALARIAEQRKPVIILSNSGKRSEVNAGRLVSFGFPRDHFKDVLTSGEIAYQKISQALGTTIERDAKVMVLAREGDASPVADLGLAQTQDPKEADLLLIVSRDLAKTRSDYRALFTQVDTKRCRAMCLNPDLNMLSYDGLAFSAGTLARDFEQVGGRVEWFGKPHAQIYQSALELLPGVPRGRILCVGDSIDHDILGGHRAGLATALVLGGVHADLTPDQLGSYCEEVGVVPDHLLRFFAVDQS